MGDVLVIEDDEMIREMISHLVRESGHTVTAPEEVLEGLQYLIRRPGFHKKHSLAIVQIHPRFQDAAVRKKFITELESQFNAKSILGLVRRCHIREILLIGRGAKPLRKLQRRILDYIPLPTNLSSEWNLRNYYSDFRERIKRGLATTFLIYDLGDFHGLNLCGIFGSPTKLKGRLTALARAVERGSNILIVGEKGLRKSLLLSRIEQRSQKKNSFILSSDYKIQSESRIAENLPLFLMNEGKLILGDIGSVPMDRQDEFRISLKEASEKGFQVFATLNSRYAQIPKDFRKTLKPFILSLLPLRDRTEEIENLARFHLNEISRRVGRDETPSMSVDFLDSIRTYPWPGNIDQLVSSLTSTVSKCEGMVLRSTHISPFLKRMRHGPGVNKPSRRDVPTAHRKHWRGIEKITPRTAEPISAPLEPSEQDKEIAPNENPSPNGRATSAEEGKPSSNSATKTVSFYFYLDEDSRNTKFFMIGSDKLVEFSYKVGLERLQFLLMHPNVFFDALEVGYLGNVPHEFDKSRKDDFQRLSRDQIRERRKTKKKYLEFLETVDDKDSEEAAICRERIDEIDDELRLKGTRDPKSPLGLARTRVTKSIKESVLELSKHIKGIDRYLNDHTIKTGYNLAYRPLVGQEPTWKFSK